MGFLDKYFLNIDENEISSHQSNLFNYNYQPWDITNDFNLNKIQNNSSRLNSILNSSNKNAFKKLNQIQKILTITISITVIGIISSFILPILGILSFFSWPFSVLSLIGLAIVAKYKHKLTVDLIKFQICKDNNWYYNPEKSKDSYYSLRGIFNELFNKGDENQYIEDEIWGITPNNKNYFYSGIFSYDNVSRDSKGRKNRTTHKKHFIAISLTKNTNIRFYLYPENVFSRIGNFFTKKEINTESIEFNKTYAFSYFGVENNKQEIVKILSPAVQEKLIDLSKLKKNPEVLFNDNCIVFMFQGELFKKIHTNFSKTNSADSKDLKFINSQINNLTTIGNEISEYLD